MLVWLAIAAIALVLCLGSAYALSLYHFRIQANQLAQANSHRVVAVLTAAVDVLERLEQATAGQCSATAIEIMNHAVFHGAYFREAGIEHDGQLQCTSLQMLAPGFTIESSTRVPAARIGRLEILAPTPTIQGGKSLILNWPLNEERTHFINLLLDPRQLVDGAVYPEGLQTASFLDDGPNGEQFRFDRDGSVPALPARLQVGVRTDGHGVRALARADPYPIYSEVSITQPIILQHWRTQMQPAVIAGFLLSMVAALVLRRSLPRSDVLQDLREGIGAGEIELHYQPIVDGRDQRITGVEALARWRHPKRGVVMPDEFIPLAEASGLVTELTDQLLQQVERDLQVLGELPAGFRISFNLATAQLADLSLIGMLDRIFGAEARLDRLAFEITERELLDKIAVQARSVVEELVRRGALVSLDDFGTGYSGLSHLRHLSLHQIKIDGSFVHALDTEAVTASLVENIVALASSLGMGTVAEGIETEAQRQRLLDLGVHLQQGWLYAKAMSLEDLRCTLQIRATPIPA